jgi:hypothetical protein
VPSLDSIDLTNDQMDAIARALAAVQPAHREPFLHAFTRRLRGHEVGDGSVGRAIRECFTSGEFLTLQTVAIGKSVGGVGGKGQARGSVTGRQGYSKLASGSPER